MSYAKKRNEKYKLENRHDKNKARRAVKHEKRIQRAIRKRLVRETK